MFCGVSGDFNPLHSDEEHCRGTRFGTRIAHGPLGMSMAIGLMSQLNLIHGTALGLLNLNWDFRGPIRLGDTIHARVTTDALRRTKDRKSVVSGKRVSVRVDLGARRLFKKNKTILHNRL